MPKSGRHPARVSSPRKKKLPALPSSTGPRELGEALIPKDAKELEVRVDDRSVKLTNLKKVFWKELGYTKGDLIRYYADLSPVLLPHIEDRAMVMKRYPNGADGDHFFMKRTPSPRPAWLSTCSIEHGSGNVIDFPMIQDLPALLWVINLGCIDLNQWYARCDDVDTPDYVHFDLDPTPGATFEHIREAALVLKSALEDLEMTSFVKTTGSRGLHIYVPIVRGPSQKDVWLFAKELSRLLAQRNPKLLTAEYKIARRPKEHVLVDYNQNAWGRTLASVYSVRPTPSASVSAPVTWNEVEEGFEIADFRLENMRERVHEIGDLWAPLNDEEERVDLSIFVGGNP
jgi:bifunctional non-homologous end joining protein LigD